MSSCQNEELVPRPPTKASEEKEATVSIPEKHIEFLSVPDNLYNEAPATKNLVKSNL